MTRRAIALAFVIVALAGCEDPYQQKPRATPSSTAGPRAAVEGFCRAWANWTWQTIGSQQRRLARQAAGPLARQLATEARSRDADQALRRDRSGRVGRVVAIDVQAGGRVVCVTLEKPIAGGRLDPEGARHLVYLARVTWVAGGWAIASWEPEP